MEPDKLKSTTKDFPQMDMEEQPGRCPSVKIGCVLLASGFSTRFSSNKLLADFQGTPLIAHTMAALSRTQIDRVSVVTRYSEIKELAESFSFRCVLHDHPQLSDTIRLGIGDLGEDVDGYMLCVADQPLLTPETIRMLVGSFAMDPARIIRPRCGDAPGNPVIFPAALREDLMALQGDQGGRAVIKKHPQLLKFAEIRDPRELMDVDTVETLRQLQ